MKRRIRTILKGKHRPDYSFETTVGKISDLIGEVATTILKRGGYHDSEILEILVHDWRFNVKDIEKIIKLVNKKSNK
jgi:hypothetical protein